MNKNFSIQLKAAFLLVVFSINTISGFACAMGINLGFDHSREKATRPLLQDCERTPYHKVKRSGSHHQLLTARQLPTGTPEFEQANDKGLLPEAKTCHSKPGQSPDEDNSNNDYSAGDNSRSCCGDKMIQFDKLDKSVVKSSTIVNPVFLNILISAFYDVQGSLRSEATPNFKYFVRSHHLPIPDIRVIIRSFQV